jgi:hypothetical protein
LSQKRDVAKAIHAHVARYGVDELEGAFTVRTRDVAAASECVSGRDEIDLIAIAVAVILAAGYSGTAVIGRRQRVDVFDMMPVVRH